MHPPVAVPANGGPSTSARVARPALENVTCTTATPVGSPGLRQPDATPAADPSAALAAARSNSPPTSSTCCSATVATGAGFGSLGSAFGSFGAAADVTSDVAAVVGFAVAGACGAAGDLAAAADAAGSGV